jgi:Fe-S cluster biogenesis protein NfuA
LRDRVQELVQNLMDFHGAGLARMVDSLRQTGAEGEGLLRQWTSDEVTSSLLLLYGLHPEEMTSRVCAALDGLRPELRAQGVEVELLGIDDGVVRLQMTDKDAARPSSSIAVRRKIAKAIYEAAPDAAGIKADGDAAHPRSKINFIPMSQINGNGTCKITDMTPASSSGQ